jgi:2-oxoglutarate ferredoxin oxidoreductase subunit beta
MQPPKFPTPIGVFRAVEREVYDRAAREQIQSAKEERGPGDLDELFSRGDSWDVPEPSAGN